MSGPSTKRENINAAPIPGLTGNLQQLLQQFASGQNPFASWGQPSALQQQTGNTFGNYLNQPSAQQRTFDSILPQLQQIAGGFGQPQGPTGLQGESQDALAALLRSGPTAQQQVFAQANPQIQALMGRQTAGFDQIFNNASGQGIVNAAQPIFQRNLQLTADTLRQAGPRFASNTERLVGEQGNKALQDFNLFSQQAMQSGRDQQLAALAGLTQGQLGAFGMLGGLGQGADQSILARNLGVAGGANDFATQQLQQFLGNRGMQLQGLNAMQSGAQGIDQQTLNAMIASGQFANTMQGQNLGFQGGLLQQLLGLLGQGGMGPAVLTQNPGSRGQILNALGQLGGMAATAAAGSSRRFKTVVRDLATIGGVRIVHFRYHGSSLDHIGCIAEEVAPLYPHTVVYDEHGAPWGIKYDVLTAALREAA